MYCCIQYFFTLIINLYVVTLASWWRFTFLIKIWTFPTYTVQVNLCQKLLFLHQLTHNMTTHCSLNYEWSTYMKITSSEHVVYINCPECQNKTKTTCSAGILSLQFSWTMNNLLSYCGLVDAKIRASDKDLPVFLLRTW